MRDRPAQILKLICIGLAALLVVQLVKIAMRANPLARVTMPEVPSLPADTNAPAAAATKPPGKPETNAIAAANGTNGSGAIAAGNGTNGPAIAADTNAVPRKKARTSDTNATAIIAASTNPPAASNFTVTTNLVLSPPSNAGVTIVATTNAVRVIAVAQSNSAPAAEIATTATNTNGTNLAITLPTNAMISGSNIALAKFSGGTNLAGGSARTNSTNSAIAKASGAKPPSAAMMTAMMGGPGGKKPAALPPEIQARVDRVYESEIFAPVNHPVPMALLGIAGQTAFLRAPSGQTGLVKEGEELGEIKLLRIGTNRVLVEQDGKKQELMIFAGLGGESLLPKSNETSDETTKH